MLNHMILNWLYINFYNEASLTCIYTILKVNETDVKSQELLHILFLYVYVIYDQEVKTLYRDVYFSFNSIAYALIFL